MTGVQAPDEQIHSDFLALSTKFLLLRLTRVFAQRMQALRKSTHLGCAPTRVDLL